MRQTFSIYVILVCIAFLYGCSNDEDTISGLDIVSVKLDFPAQGGEGYIQFQSLGEDAVVKLNEDWCMIKETTADKIILQVAGNYDYIGRNAILTVTTGLDEKSFNINQAGAVFAHNEDEWLIRASNSAGRFPLSLYGSYECIVDIPVEAQEWLSFEPSTDDKGGTFVVKENTSGTWRATNVHVTSGDRFTDYQIIQYDLNELMLGSWNMLFTDVNLGSAQFPEVEIAKNADGTYTLSNLVPGSPYTLKATAVDNCLSFPAGQLVGSFTDEVGTAFVAFRLISADMMFVSDPNVSISLGPVYSADGTLMLTFGRVRSNDPIAFTLSLYEDEALTVYSDELLTFLNCMMYKTK